MNQGNFPPGPADISDNPVKQYMYYRDFLGDPLGKVMGLMGGIRRCLASHVW